MRILFINDYCDERGGAQVIDRRLSESLAERGHKIEFFCGGSSGYLSDFVKSHYSLSDTKDLKQTLTDFSPDVCFSSCLGYRLSPWLLKIVDNAGVPVCLKVPDYSIYEYSNVDLSTLHRIFGLPRKISHRIAVGQFTDCLVAQSDNSREYAINTLSVPPSDTHVIKNPTLFDPVDTPNPSDSGNVLYVGRIERDKGIEQLIRAVSQEDRLSIRLIGDGGFREDAKQLCQSLCRDDQFEFTGYVEHSRLPEYYRQASVFALPSTIKESFGLTILEAMSQGTPAVTTNIGAQQELVQDGKTGFSVAPGDIGALTESLVRVGTDLELNKRLSHNALRYAGQFTLDKYVTRIQHLFEELISERKTK